MHKGFRMMLEALGIHIDPVEIESLFLKLKQDIPALGAYFEKQFSSLDARLAAIERTCANFGELAGENLGVDRREGAGSRSTANNAGSARSLAPVNGVAPDQLLTSAEMVLWESEEIGHREMRDILIKRLVAIRRQKTKEALANGHNVVTVS